MNRRAITIGLVYSAAVILFKLVILLGGYTLSKFGFYYAHILSALVIIPFIFLAVYQVREKENNGVIGGKECIRVALTLVAVSAVILSVYNYIEFDWKYKEIATTYYRSEEYLAMLKEQQLKYPDKLKTEQFPQIIEAQINSLSASRATTGKLFTLLVMGISGAFMAGVFLKRPAANPI